MTKLKIAIRKVSDLREFHLKLNENRKTKGEKTFKAYSSIRPGQAARQKKR